MNIVVANGPGKLENGSDVILFPSRWDSGVQAAPFRFYPYELAYLSSLLKRELPSDYVRMIDGNILGYNAEQYAAAIKQHNPDVVVCECSALTYGTMTKVIQLVQPKKAILCGPMSTYPAASLDGWTNTVIGEYEHKVLALLKGEPQPMGYVDLDWLPWPEDEDISRIEYDEINHYSRGVLQVYPTRGCPLSCTFCVVPTYYGGHGKSHKSHRCRNAENVCDEIESLARKYQGRFSGCYFNEEAHNANVEWFVNFCETLIKRGLNKYQYDCMAGAWVMTEELTALMARAGYRQFRFGVESTSEKVGKSIKKTIHKEKIEQVLGWLKKYNVGAYITLQVGAMGSTEEIDIATIKDAKGWIQRGLVQKWQLSTSTPQPNTPFYEQAKANGWLVTEDFRYFNGWNAVVSYPDYPAERIQAVRAGCGL